jgi:hypothetical protein
MTTKRQEWVWIALTGKVLRTQGDVPDRHDDARDESENLTHEYEAIEATKRSAD